MIRVNHYGMDATIGAVQNSLAALGAALTEQGVPVDLEGARSTVGKTWR